MSDLLEYLRVNSKVAKSLDEDFTLEDLLMSYCKTPEQFTKTIELLGCLPKLETDRFKVSNCLFDGVLPYDSLKDATSEDIEELCKLADYLQLPTKIEEKLQNVAKHGLKFINYRFNDSEDPEVFDDFENFNIRSISDYAIIGDLRGIQRLHALGFRIDPDACVQAAHNGYLDCLEYMDKYIAPSEKSELVCEAAAHNGHLDCLRYAFEHKYYCDETAFDNAIEGRNLDCLEYLYDNECPMGTWKRSYLKRTHPCYEFMLKNQIFIE